jgi:two-component system, NtrC family, response regulator
MSPVARRTSHVEPARLLVVDDDPAVTAALTLVLRQAGYGVRTADGPAAAREVLAREAFASRSPSGFASRSPSGFDLVLLDMNFSRRTTGEEGLDLLAAIRRDHPGLPVVLMTAWGSIELAVRGMQAGATDFLTKPWSNARLLESLSTALRLADVHREGPADSPRTALEAKYDLTGVIGEDPAFLSALELALRVAPTEASVLVTGETGTGKEVVAQAIHRNSGRRGGPFVGVNLGGIPPGLFESELFGHVRGAFTDAVRDRAGRFETARGGTLFLDEAGDLDAAAQVKLLRVLQERTFEPLGASESRSADVRVVSATHRPLRALVGEGRFREDLFFRLNLIAVHLPALRERPRDVPVLAAHFLEAAGRAHGRRALAFAPDALALLARQPWPGNVRQLRHVVERAVLVATQPTLMPGDVEFALRMDVPEAAPEPLPAPGTMTLDALERTMIERALAAAAGNVSHAADALGLSRQALYRRMEKHGLSEDVR